MNDVSTNYSNNYNEIFQKKLHINNNIKITNKSFNEKNLLNMSNIQFFRHTNNFKSYQNFNENDRNYLNVNLQRNNLGKNIINNSMKFSIVKDHINDYYENDRTLKYEIESKNIKLNYLNRKYLYGSDYKNNNNNNNNNGSRLIKLHSQLNSSINNFDSSTCSKEENIFENQSIGNYYIKW